MKALGHASQLELAELPTRLHKVVRKVCVVLERPTVGDVLALDPADFQARPGVGRLYVKRFVELQQALATLVQGSGAPEAPPPRPVDLAGATLAWNELGADDAKAVRRVERALQRDLTVAGLLGLDLRELAARDGIGRGTATALRRLRERVVAELAAVASSPAMAKLVILASTVPLSADTLETTLIGDFERLTERLDDTMQSIALSRWGYARPQRTLEEIGVEHGVSRERIRQLEAKFDALLPRSLSVSQVQIRATVDSLRGGDLLAAFPTLTQLFATTALVLRFLERCAGLDPLALDDEGDVERAGLRPLARLFATTAAPITIDQCLAELGGRGLSEPECVRYLASLRASGRVTVTDDVVAPHRLERAAAFAHVLAGIPEGLFWQDLARICNARRLCATPVSETRRPPLRSSYLYLSGRGSYRHVRFLQLEHVEPDALLGAMRAYLEERQLRSCNLQAIAHAVCPDFDYFTVRYVVSEFGEERGLYFDGRSTNDTVSLDANVARTDIASTLRQLLADSPTALTVGELAERLRSRSLSLTQQAIWKLRSQGAIVRVEEQLYTTVERAFDGFDWDHARRHLGDLLHQDDRPAEIGWLRERFNVGQASPRSRFFLLDAVRLIAGDAGWHVVRTLVDRKPIRFAGLHDIFREAHQEGRALAETLAEIERHVRIDRMLVPRLLSNWLGGQRAAGFDDADDA